MNITELSPGNDIIKVFYNSHTDTSMGEQVTGYYIGIVNTADYDFLIMNTETLKPYLAIPRKWILKIEKPLKAMEVEWKE